MPYVLETITSKASPTAASQAAKTKRTTGNMKELVKLMLREIIVASMNRDNIMPSRHKSEDMRWDR